jgi:8-oxo-dGTP pyrophosphatase MutT (NUDIX family)
MRTLQGAIASAIIGAKALLSPVAFGANALALDETGRVLLVRHRYMPGWHLPGGGVKRAEPPAEAVIRELREETGLVSNDAPEFASLHTRKAGLATNLIALYRVRNVRIDFRPNAEILEVLFADPAAPPSGTAAGTRRRLAEFVNGALPSPYW